MLLQCLLLLLMLLVVVVVKKRLHKYVDLHKQIGTDFPYVPIIGHAYKFYGSNEDRMSILDTLGRQANRSKHGLVSIWLLHWVAVFISDGPAASAVLRTCSDKWPASLFAWHLVGNGSIFANEKEWNPRRKILIPMFASKYYASFVRIFERNNKPLMADLAALAGKGDVSMWNHFSGYSADSALDMLFGGTHARKRFSAAFLSMLGTYNKHLAARMLQVWQYSNTAYKLTRRCEQQRRYKTLIWDIIENLISKKKMDLANEKLKQKMNQEHINSNDLDHKTFLEMLMEFSGGEAGYTDVELREECLVLIIAATETTATAACFATVLLANHPEVQDAVYREIQDIVGDSDRPLSAADVPNLKYLDAVIKETLRLFPPKPVTLRTCKKDIELPSGVTLREGCLLILNFWGLHRNPAVWGPDADQFKPDRFLNATREQLAAFMPFGHGTRSCLGARLAMASLKLTLAELTRRFRVLPSKSYLCSAHARLRVSYEISLKHVDDFKVQLEIRR